MAQLPFGSFTDPNVRLVLLGSNHRRPFAEFANNEAIQMTEVYAYSCQLADPEFELVHFQVRIIHYLL